MASKSDEPTGTIEWRDCWYAKISVGGKRTKIKLVTADGRALDRKEPDRKLAKEMAAELSQAMRAKAAPPKIVTVEEFGEEWTSGKLYAKHGEVRKLKPKASAKDDEIRLRAHVYPHIGNISVAAVTEPMVEQCVAKAQRIAEAKRGKPWRSANKTQVYQVMRRLFDLAIKPGRLRTDNPVSVDLRPSKDAPKLYSFLYPAEFIALISCTTIPLARRVYYVLAVYTGLRKSSLSRCTWFGFDFMHGTITSLINKNKVPQIFAQADPTLPGLASAMVVLEKWYALQGAPGANRHVVPDLECPKRKEAETLRRDLKAAGITRPHLFERSEHIEPLRFHDLRATFVTWARRAGKDSGWISDRTGHLTPEIMQRYDRGARSLADLQLIPFPDISGAIPELRDSNVVTLRKR